jgi:hypothetical protein
MESETFAVFSTGLADTSDIVTGLTQGTTYKFKVESRNVIGFSPLSIEISVKAA